MFTKGAKNISYLFSLSLHIILFAMLIFVKMNPDDYQKDLLLIGFGSGGGEGSPGSGGQISNVEQNMGEPEKVESSKEDTKIDETPVKSVNDEEKLFDKSKKKENKESRNGREKPLVKGGTEGKGSGLEGKGSGTGGEGTGTGNGGFGYELDFGGKGTRGLYSHSLPEYPEGVSKEIDIKLRFTIMPDGTVSRIVPLMKADARLETAAINSLRQWRFQPLPSNVQQIEQTVVIVFPYRLR